MKKPLDFVEKPRVLTSEWIQWIFLTSEVDGSRTRNLRIDSPVL